MAKKAVSAESKEELFNTLKLVGETMVKTFGDTCEVVLHDLNNPDHSIVWICGDVTGRQPGMPITDLGLARLRDGSTIPLCNYTNHTEDGKVLKTSTIVMRDKEGEPFAALCINVDISSILACEQVLAQFTAREDDLETSQHFAKDVGSMLSNLMAEASAAVGKPVELMDTADKIEFVAYLERKGAFKLRKAAPLVAARLGVSRPTIYNYLRENENSKPDNQ
ncbi:MAG: PAS domain-containing protein [Anaerolineales bacterium]|nr:PAS domain-containing protein [Anaerolineales bacterium]